MRQWTGSALVQVMACRLFGAKPLPEPMLKDLSMMYRAMWDRKHEGGMRISQYTMRLAPSALTYPSGLRVPPISQYSVHHA